MSAPKMVLKLLLNSMFKFKEGMQVGGDVWMFESVGDKGVGVMTVCCSTACPNSREAQMCCRCGEV